MNPWFIATERFDSSDGDNWTRFVAWAGLPQLQELVSLDPMLCPTLLGETKDEYWPHIVNEDFHLNFFVDFEFLKRAVAAKERKNMLCVFRNPTIDPIAPGFARFKFLGYDVVDIQNSVSALTNCGGFPKSFSAMELSSAGLLPDRMRACNVREDLRRNYPEDPHANCNYWAIFRAEP